MAVNKVVYGGVILVDLTGDTVTEDSLQYGSTAHSKDGKRINGSNLGEKPVVKNTAFSDDSVLETFKSGQTLKTVFNSDGSITETLTDGRYWKTVFNGNQITETLYTSAGKVIRTKTTTLPERTD